MARKYCWCPLSTTYLNEQQSEMNNEATLRSIGKQVLELTVTSSGKNMGE